MAEPKKPPYALYAVVAAVVVLAIIVFFALAPVRRPVSTINGAPATANLTGGPVNGVGPSVGGNNTGAQ